MLVGLLSNEVDFSIVCRGTILYSRTTRWADNTSAEEMVDWLVAEINRTLIAAPHDPQCDESTVEEIALFGSRDEQESLRELLAGELDLPVSLVDPFDGIEFEGTEAPRHSHWYAALVGLIRDQVAGHHAINLVHPKQPRKPKNQRKRIAGYASVAAVLILVGFYGLWDQVRDAKLANQELAKDRASLRKVLAKANKKRAVVEAVRQWQAADVNWLDELNDLSIRFPGTNDVVVQRLTVAPVAPGGGVVEMQVQVSDPKVLSDLENRLRDESHQIDTEGALQRNEGSQYEWQSSVTLLVKRRTKAQYLSDLSVNRKEPMNPELESTDSLASRRSPSEERQ